MKFIRQSAVAALCAASYAAFLVPASAADQPPAAAQHGPGAAPGPGPGERGPGMPDAPFEHRPFDHWPRGPMGVPGHLRHLDLSEAQQDKLFAIMHAAAPRRREQDKAERKAHEALRALSGEARFDEAKAAAAARDLGQAVAAGALLRSRVEAQVLAVLTPEQRERLRRDRPDERR